MVTCTLLLPGMRQHLALQTEVPLDPTPCLHHFLSVMHETGGKKMEDTSLCSQNRLGQSLSSYPCHGLQVVPKVMRKCSPPSLKVGHSFSPENVSS